MTVGQGVGLDVGTRWAIAVRQVTGTPVDEAVVVIEPATVRPAESGAVVGEDLLATATAGLLVTAAARFPELPADPQVVATHPAHWGEETVAVQRAAFDRAGLGPVRLVPDAVAAVAWLEAARGPVGDGVMAVLDLGAAGVTVSLVRVGGAARLLPPSVYSSLFGGDSFDRMVLEHVLGSAAADLDPFDPSDPETRADLDRLRTRCRSAKEELSAAESVSIPVSVAGDTTEVTLTRADLEEILHGPLAAALSLVEETARAHELEPAMLKSVLVVGGGAAIPALADLAATLPVRAVIAPHPDRIAASGAAVLACGGEALPVPVTPPSAGGTSGPAEDDTDTLPVVPPTATPTAYTMAGTGQPVRSAVASAAPRRRAPMVAAAALAALAVTAVAAAAALTLSRGEGDDPVPAPEPVTAEPAPTTTAVATPAPTATRDAPPVFEPTTYRPVPTTAVTTTVPLPPPVAPTTSPPPVTVTTTAPVPTTSDTPTTTDAPATTTKSTPAPPSPTPPEDPPPQE